MLALAELQSGELASLEFGDPVEPLIPAEIRVREAVADLEARRVDLWDVGALDAVPVLLQMLIEAGDAPSRLIPVFRAFGFLRVADAAPILAQYLLHHANREVRLEALIGLGKLGHMEAREPLTMYLSDEDRDFRRGAIVALGKYPDVPLNQLEAAASSDPELQRLVGEARRRADAVAAHDLRALIDAIVESDEYEDLLPLMEIAWEPLTDNLKDTGRSLVVRRRSAWLLGTARVSRADDAIVSVLRNEQEPREVRMDAVWAAGRCRARDAIDPLIALLDSSPIEMQRAAIVSLGQIRHPRALEPILGLWNAHLGRLRPIALVSVRRLCEHDGSLLLTGLLRAGGSFAPPRLYLIDDSLRLSRGYRADWIAGRLGSLSAQARRDAILLLAFFGQRFDAEALRAVSLGDEDDTNRELAALAARKLMGGTP